MQVIWFLLVLCHGDWVHFIASTVSMRFSRSSLLSRFICPLVLFYLHAMNLVVYYAYHKLMVFLRLDSSSWWLMPALLFLQLLFLLQTWCNTKLQELLTLYHLTWSNLQNYREPTGSISNWRTPNHIVFIATYLSNSILGIFFLNVFTFFIRRVTKAKRPCSRSKTKFY